MHVLLGLETHDDLIAHPVAGASREGFVIENVLANALEGVRADYFRTAAGAEIDFLLKLPGGVLRTIEIKRSAAPAPSRGYHEACSDLKPARRFIVHPGKERFPLRDGIEAVPLADLIGELSA